MSDVPPNSAPQRAENWQTRLRGFADSDVTPRRAEMRRVASSARTMLHALVNNEAPEEVLAEVADALETLAAELDEHGGGSMYEGFAEAANSGDPHAFFDHSPIIGRANPLAPPISLRLVDDHIEATAVFGPAYEGPPGCVHGGFVAAAFDEVLGSTQSLSGSPGMTGRLTVHYRKPTPLNTELRFVGRLERVDGRKIYTAGEVFDGDLLTAEAEALFISIDVSKFEALKALRDAASS